MPLLLSGLFTDDSGHCSKELHTPVRIQNFKRAMHCLPLEEKSTDVCRVLDQLNWHGRQRLEHLTSAIPSSQIKAVLLYNPGNIAACGEQF